MMSHQAGGLSLLMASLTFEELRPGRGTADDQAGKPAHEESPQGGTESP